MALMTLTDVHFGYEQQVLFDGLGWSVQRGEKVGLVGPNGSGKSTIFRLMLGDLKPSIGSVSRSRGLQIAHLPQVPSLDSTSTLLEEVSKTFEQVQLLEARLAEVAQRIADHHDSGEADEWMAEYDELQHRLEAAGGYQHETLVKKVLGGLGFEPAQYDLPISVLSGGQKCRAALAKLLLQEADLLLLDEPTNHLDLDASRFLEEFLADYPGAAIVISHDRYLLDRVVSKIADLDNKRITIYPCAYSEYAESKHVRQLTAEREYEKQKTWLDHQREYAERVKADKSRAKQAKGRLRYLERMERQGKVLDKPSHHRRRMAMDLRPTEQGGEMVLRCEGVRKAYGSTVLFDGFDLEVCRGEKIGIIGPNGVGKTTLLRMAMGTVEPDAGMVKLYQNLSIGYYDQEHADLDQDIRVIDALEMNATGPVEASLRSYLARFLFTGDDVYKRIGDLSGGEQSRVVLAKLVYSNPQVLILDEPTNHLDIPAREALEDALISYGGAMILVSHDRYFLDRVINELLILQTGGRYEVMSGNWSSYEERLEREKAEREAAQAEARAQARRAAKQKRKTPKPKVTPSSPYAGWSLNRLEEAIIEAEEDLAAAEGEFANPDVLRDAERARSINQRVEQIRTNLQTLNQEWESRAEGMS